MHNETTETKTNTEAGGLVEPLVRRDATRCPDCGYTQQDAELHADHNLCKNRNPPWKKYFRSQAIPGDPCTMMYWVEYEDGKAADIDPNKIPDTAMVSDVTFERDKRTVMKKGGTFVAA